VILMWAYDINILHYIHTGLQKYLKPKCLYETLDVGINLSMTDILYSIDNFSEPN